ncbi:ABC transporter permease [Bacillus luteolus]|uniref:ABC transporter permease n=1 Tax=Litchfieldia luteola TaxID=682179 RepID=A0ABR9QKQ3_9BACI|nr:ABC transporter permease subunit [Cytobacillus luteolus]MBE4909079.1 ABC transporter permease [Cytobacillus luteolus]MBP1941935.1 peptide/nickel transport system permease protein [Cytobacillus luteolus]
MKHNRLLFIGIIMVTILLLITLIGPYIPYVKNEIDEASRVRFGENNVIMTAPFSPEEQFPFGTDREGRDLLSVLIVGAKDTLLMMLVICLIRYLLGIPLGLLASRGKGFFSWIVSSWNHIFSSVPIIFSAMILLSIPVLVLHEFRFFWSILIIALIEVGKVAHIVQEETIGILKKPYIEAGITVGMHPLRQLISNILPNILPAIVVNFFIDIGRTALLIGQMGIFGIFISQVFVQTGAFAAETVNTSLNWLTLLGQARKDILNAFWIPFYTCLVITFTVFTFNILGEGLRRHYDRRSV